MLSLCCSFLRFFLVLSQSKPKPGGWVHCYLHCILQGAEAERSQFAWGPRAGQRQEREVRCQDWASVTDPCVCVPHEHIRADTSARASSWQTVTSLDFVCGAESGNVSEKDLEPVSRTVCRGGPERAIQTLLGSLVHWSTIPELNSQNSHHWNGPFSYASKLCFLGEIWNSSTDTRSCRHTVT